MKNKFIFLTLLFPLLLTGCATELQEVYNGDEYNDPIFANNYYEVYPNQFLDESKIISETEVTLTDSDFFRSYDQNNYELLNKIDPIIAELPYTSYGEYYKLSKVDDSFKKGIISKLFDGNMFCNGLFQLSRIQVSESGFGVLFNKEIYSYDYFVINFKSALNFIDNTPVGGHASSIVLKLSFYLRNGINFNKININAEIDDIPTNVTETNSPLTYIFFAVDLKNNIKLQNIDFTRLCGFSLSYDLLSDEVKDNTTKQSDYALMLYEVLFPNSTWL